MEIKVKANAYFGEYDEKFDTKINVPNDFFEWRLEKREKYLNSDKAWIQIECFIGSVEVDENYHEDDLKQDSDN